MSTMSLPTARLRRGCTSTRRFSTLLRCLVCFSATLAPASAAPVISEFMASNHATLADQDGDFPDWIELYNPDPAPVELTGWYLTDSAKQKTKWQFPAVALAPGAWLVVFASDKNLRDPSRPLHTNFSLDADGEYLGLIKPDGTTVVSEFAPSFPAQPSDVSYGVTQPAAGSGESPQTGWFGGPTPGARNGPAAALILPERVSFSIPSGPFSRYTALTLTGATAGETIRFTLTAPSATGAIAPEPTAASSASTAPLMLTTSVMIRAAVFNADGSRRGLSSVARYVRLAPDLAGFSSRLPVVVLDTHGAGSVNSDGRDQPVWFDLLAPADGADPPAEAAAKAGSFAAAPLLSLAASAHVHGATSASFPKQSYTVALLDDSGRSNPQSPLGLATDDGWQLISPWNYDRAFLRNACVYSLSRSLGRWAPHTRFVEVFSRSGAASLDASDYAGVSLLTERIKIDAAHVNLAPLSPSDTALPAIGGGYLLKIDVAAPGDFSFATSHLASWTPHANLIVCLPKADKLPPAQRDYISGYVQTMENALYADAASGWLTHRHLLYLDRASWVDYHLLQVLSGNVDALIRSTYFSKDRDGKLVAGPLWDFDRSLGSADARNQDWSVWNSTDAGDYWNFGWWGVLTRDPEFMQAWIDRWQQLRRKELSAAQLAALADNLAAQIGPAAAARDAARWPDDTGRDGGGWAGEIARLKTWVANRASWIDQQFVAPPVLETDGVLLVVTAPAGAQLAYTLNGVDPRGPNGQFGLGALVSAGPLVVDAGALLCVRAWNPTMLAFPGSPWSAPLAATDAARIGATTANPLFQSRLANLSSLVHLGPAESAPLTGFVVSGPPAGAGTGGKQFLVRCVGPALAQFGIADALPDPVLRITAQDGTEIARNSGWSLGPDVFDLPRLTAGAGAFLLPFGSGDAALLVLLAPGTYTLQASSASGRTGTVLTEVYELDRTGGIASISTCAAIGLARPTLVGGFTVTGAVPKKFLVRAVGPALGAFGVAGALPDPVLTIRSGSTTVARNDDWGTPTAPAGVDPSAVAAAAVAAGTFALPSAGRDAAVLITLAPGNYTAEVTGKNDTTGIVLLEIYATP